MSNKNQSSMRSRKWQLTINNPKEKGLSHEQIKNNLSELKLEYWCMCDETGEEGTYHTHLYISSKNAISFSTIKKRFQSAHIEKANGTAKQNRDYIRKEGNYLNSEKKTTNHDETFEEWGELPVEKQGSKDSVSADIVEMIKDGYSYSEIIDKHPSAYNKIAHMEQAKQAFLADKYRTERRMELEVTYIYGEAGTGKTRYVLEENGIENVFRVTNYKNPFDGYNGEPVLLLDEFRGGILFSEMLNICDIYPLRLPCRYTDRWACFTKVYIVSNISLAEQYKNIQQYEPDSYNALIRRIHKVIYLGKDEAAFENVDNYRL